MFKVCFYGKLSATSPPGSVKVSKDDLQITVKAPELRSPQQSMFVEDYVYLRNI